MSLSHRSSSPLGKSDTGPSTSVQKQNRSSTVAGMLLGIGGTLVFYLAAPWAAKPFAAGPAFVQRYFCGHPLEYITSTMFFIGLGILWTKWRLLPRERRALRSIRELAENQAWVTGSAESAEVVSSLKEWQSDVRSRSLGATTISQRLHDVLHYVTNRQDRGLEDHLRYLADLASDRLLQSYSLIRTLTWAVPIMGFLGTVVGITMAIANVTPEQLDSSLPEVTSGLAVAFDTTAQALGISIILVFATFLIERGEQSVLNDVEQFGIDHLVPSLRSEEIAAQQSTGIPALTEWTSQMLAQQTEFWNRHLSSLQNGWADALTRQTHSLAQALSQETQMTLQVHRDGVTMARDSYASSLQQSTQSFNEQMQQTLGAFVERVDAWQNAMQATTISSAGQTEELHRLGRTLLRMTESEERLVQLQELLNQNLQTLQVVETLEQTVNSLNAAVSVLTAKTSLRAVA